MFVVVRQCDERSGRRWGQRHCCSATEASLPQGLTLTPNEYVDEGKDSKEIGTSTTVKASVVHRRQLWWFNIFGRYRYNETPNTDKIVRLGAWTTFEVTPSALTYLIQSCSLKEVERSTSFTSSTWSIHHHGKTIMLAALLRTPHSRQESSHYDTNQLSLCVQVSSTMRASYYYTSLWTLMLLHLRRNAFVLRAYAFASSTAASTTANDLSSSSSTAFFRSPTSSRLFSSLSERTEPSVPLSSSSSSSSLVGKNKYLSITATTSSTLKSFGGICYTEIPEGLQRVVFVLGGPGSGKVRPSSLLCFGCQAKASSTSRTHISHLSS